MGSALWEKDFLRPTVACIATEDVNKCCQLNNLTLEQMLQPFCEFPEISLPFRSLGGSITLKSLHVNLIRASNMVASPPEANNTRLSDAVGDDEVVHCILTSFIQMLLSTQLTYLP